MDLAPDAPPDQVAQAYATFLSNSAKELEEIQQAAHPQIRGKVLAQIAAQRQAASGDLLGLGAVSTSGAEVREYEDKECHRRR